MGDRYRGYIPPAHRAQLNAYHASSRDRDRDDNVEYFGAGESYRPGGHAGGPYRPQSRATDSWSSDRRRADDRRDRDDRRDDRREDRRDEIDSYIPPTSVRARRAGSRSPSYRRRSRSPAPANRDRGDLFANRTRSPPRRYSPRRDDRRRSRSPIDNKRRDFSNSPKRDDRARSPSRRGYTPARDSRRGGYRSRSRSQPRKAAYNDDNWRPGSPSAADSGNNSRRSSPPIHPDRSFAGSARDSPAYQSNRRDSPPRGYSQDDDMQQNGDAPPTGPAASRNGAYDRPPPSGPSRGYSSSTPTGPGSMSAHNRGGFGARGGAPSGPRGFTAPSRDFVSPPGRARGSSLTYRAPTAPRSTSYQGYPDGPPSGPRGSGFGRGDFGGRGDYSYRGGRGGGAEFPFRGNNSSSSTYPRTQRFNNTQPNYLATTNQIIAGGKLLPSGLAPEQEKRLRQLEADAERMREELKEKQRNGREAVNEWEVRERESEREALRSELAEESLRELQNEEGATAAF
jgi:hypothetical protein